MRNGSAIVSNWICCIIPYLINENILSADEVQPECLINSSNWTNPTAIFNLIFNITEDLISLVNFFDFFFKFFARYFRLNYYSKCIFARKSPGDGTIE